MSDYVWWKHGVFYQIYPRSFMDSNGDGIGDLQGIIDRMDYLVDLGVDAIWISPFYESPMKDFGYDISNHKAIHPLFGDMETLDRLIISAHERRLRVVLDYVPNHTSDQHPWFLEARSSREHSKREWFLWKDPHPQGGPPNNWESFFGGSAWEWDKANQQYYLHLFLKEQPDVNWRNPDLASAMLDIMHFWLKKGVDGLRVDAVIACLKHPDFPDNPIHDNHPFTQIGLSQEPKYTVDQPDLHDLLREFRHVSDQYEDRVLLGETGLFDWESLMRYYGQALDEFQIPFNFQLMFTPWNVQAMQQKITEYYAHLPQGAMPNFVLGNHDAPRVATRFGHQNHRSVGMLLLTLYGIPTLYYGDELGMENGIIPPDQIQDPWALNKPEAGMGRDPMRTPMQWDASSHAGFTSANATPWLPVAVNYKECNVDIQRKDPQSTLHFYKKLLHLRRTSPALHRGNLNFLKGLPENILGYARLWEAQHWLVLINFGEDSCLLNLPEVEGDGKVLLSSHSRDETSVSLKNIELEPHESLLLEIGASFTEDH